MSTQRPRVFARSATAVARVTTVVLAMAACQGRGGDAPCGSGRDDVGRIDGEPLACADFLAALREDQGEAFFGRYVDRRLVERAAQKQGVSVQPATLDQAVEADIADTLRSRFNGDRKAMVEQLSKYGVSFENWKRQRRREKETDLLAKALIEKGPSEAAIDGLFEQRFGKGGLRRKVRQMFFSADPAQSRRFPVAEYETQRAQIDTEQQALATKLRERLVAGEDMAALAREFSDDAAAGRGGEVAEGQLARLGADIEAAVQRLKPGELSPVLATGRGYHLIRVEGTRRGAHYQGGHIFLAARSRGPDDTRTEAARFADARARMDDVRARILGGAAFGDVAAEVTDDPSTRERKGDLGAFESGRLGAEVDEALETIALNTPSEPIRTATGWEMVFLFSREFDPSLDRRILRGLTLSTEYPKVKARRLATSLPALAQAAANEASGKIAAGADFAVLARSLSEDESTRRTGGELPNYRQGQLGDEVDAALANMKPGERRVVPTVKGSFLLEYVAELKTERAAVADELRRELSKRVITGGEIKRYIDELRSQAKIEKSL